MHSLDVILCAYNAEKTINRCIDSILNQTFDDFKLFIFDDCSTDDTIKKTREYKDNRITLITADKNIGTYCGKNFLLKNFCQAEYVALHDADDLSELARFQRQIEYMDVNAHVACLGTNVYEHWNDDYKPHTVSHSDVSNNTRINMYSPLLTRVNLKEAQLYLSSDEYYKSFLQFKLCMNGTVMLRKSILDKLGGWDGYTRVGGDTDLFIRLLANNEIHNLQECLYHRYFHRESLTASDEYGINSYLRKRYALSRLATVEYALDGEDITRSMLYPKNLKYEIVSCVE